MDTGWNPLNRSSPSLNLLKVVMAGFLLGTTSFLAKTVLSEVIEFELISLIMVLQNPAFYVLVFTGVWGFFLLQSAIHVGKISINVAVAEGFIIIISTPWGTVINISSIIPLDVRNVKFLLNVL